MARKATEWIISWKCRWCSITGGSSASSVDGLDWQVIDDCFCEGMDIGLLKDENNDLLPIVFQFQGDPLYLKAYRLDILES